MNNDADKTKEQLLAELAELRKESKEQEDQLKATNQQLEVFNQQLEASNEQLQASEQTLKKQAYKLNERIKELNCLHSISELVRTRETMEEILKDVTEVIPPSWQYPHITGSNITLWDKEYKTENYEDSQWKLSSDIRVNKKIAGKIEVCYLEKKPESDIGPFLNEERILLDDITERLGRIIERKNAEEALKATNQQLNANNQQLQASEQQLRAANQQLIASEQVLKKEKLFSERIVETADAIIVGLDKDHIIRIFNQGAEQITGYKKEEVIGKDWVKIFFPEEILDEMNKVWKDSWGVKSHSYINPILSKTGEEKIVSWQTTGMYDGHDASKHLLLSIGEDITERMQAEEKLKAVNQQLTASNQQLLATEQQLRAYNQQLIASEKALKKSESKLNAAQHLARIGDFSWNVITGEVTWSDGMYKLLKYDKDETIDLADVNAKIHHPDDLDRITKWLNDCLASGKDKLKPNEYRLIRKDGKVIFVHTEGNITYENGKAVSVFGMCQDISERVQAEKELAKLYAAVTQSPIEIAITDTKGNLQYVNPKFIEITGYSIDEAIGQNPSILKSGEQPDEMYKELWETISSGKTWRGEFHNKKKNSELFWEMASISPLFDEQGKIVNYIKVAEDITERKQAEDNFRHSIDDSPLGIRIVDQAGKTIYVNRALLDIYEFSSLNEFVNTNALERYTDKSYQEHLERKEIRKKGWDTNEYEISIRRKNGEIRHIKVWRKEVIWNREKHFQVINQDITELKHLNTDLILAKEKAEESDRLKSAFLTNMSHEIRTPMNGILGFTQLLKEPQLTGDEKDEYIEIIEKSGKRMLDTINDIVDISRIEAGEVKVTKTEVSVNEILEELYSFFYNQAQSKGLELIYKPGLSDKEAHSVTDKHKLEGVLTNLIKNAIKFTNQGEITFACSLKKEQDIDVLEFFVKDTGIGIPSNRINAIFNRFEQADIADTRVHQGSGLGLAIAKSYVEMLGGEITVSSKVGSGSTFTFSIPYHKQNWEESGATQKKVEESDISLKNSSVIVAEDDETSRMFLETILKNRVKRITYTTTGEETVAKFRENPDTDIILMDIKMPDMNGYNATREIRKFNSDVIIIAQTAFGLSGDRKKALEAGCDEYISKPIKKEMLFEKIRACLNKKSI